MPYKVVIDKYKIFSRLCCDFFNLSGNLLIFCKNKLFLIEIMALLSACPNLLMHDPNEYPVS